MRKQYTAAFKAKLVLELLKENKALSQLAAEHKVHPNQLRQWRDAALKELPTLFEKKDQTTDLVAAHERQVEELYAEIGRLTTHVAWLKKNLVSTLSRANRLALIEREAGELSLVVQAELLGISRSSLYYTSVLPSVAEVALKHRIDELYTAHPFYGSRRLRVCLQREGLSINRKTVQRYMREMGIVAIYPGLNLSKRELAHRVHPYLLRGVRATEPDHIWGIDITYIRLVAGWLYLVAVLDWYSRYVISWELSDSLEIEFVLAAVEGALRHAKPQIWNSDQGSHFTSPQYIERLQAAEVQISMDGKGRALDNILTERLWRTIKYEEVYLHDYTTPRIARQGLTQYLEFYNHERPHQALNYQTPAELYRGTRPAVQFANNLMLKGADPT
jgi:putative transposase